MGAVEVILTPPECYHAGLVGYRRNLEAIIKGRKPRFPETVSGELYGYHILAAQAELATAKALGCYWSFHEGKFSAGDVGDYEVRYSQRADLKVRPRDEGVVISVTGYTPTFRLVGWINASDAKQKEWEKDFGKGNPAYFVPHENLHDIRILGEAKWLKKAT